MVKQTIEWHETCLKNMLNSISRTRKEMIILENDFNRQNVSIDILSRQISRARREGVKGFDNERYDIPRKVKNATKRV